MVTRGSLSNAEQESAKLDIPIHIMFQNVFNNLARWKNFPKPKPIIY